MSKPQSTTPTIPALESELHSLKLAGPTTKAIRSKYEQIKSSLNKLYATNKSTLMQFESTNYDSIALMRSTHDFYKVFGHSALFYTYSIAPKLNLKANLQTDHDFTAKSEHGFISIRDPESLDKPFRTLGITKSPTKSSDFIMYKLPWTFTTKQLTHFIDNNHHKLRHFNHVVMVDNAIPILFVQSEELLKAVYENVRNMPGPVERQAFGYQLVTATSDMLHLYLDLTNGIIPKDTCLKAMREKLYFIKYQVKLISDLKIWQPKVAARIGDIIIKVQDIITQELKNI